MVPGHELSGRIAAVGEGVDGWAVGTRVCVLPFGQCGECAACRAGNEQVCLHAVLNGVGLGTGRPGGYAEKVIVDERMLFTLPDAVDDRAGTLVEPLAVAVRAVAKAAMPTNEPVAVIGAGPIGLLMGLVLRERGYEGAVILSRNPGRAAMARRLGLTTVTLEELRSADPPACVFDSPAPPPPPSWGSNCCAPSGN